VTQDKESDSERIAEETTAIVERVQSMPAIKSDSQLLEAYMFMDSGVMPLYRTIEQHFEDRLINARAVHTQLVEDKKQAMAIVTKAKAAGLACIQDYVEREQARVDKRERPPLPMLTNYYTRETWTAEVHDMFALAQAVVAGHAPVEWLKANTSKLSAAARRMKTALEVPGVRVTKKVTPVMREGKQDDD